MPVGNDLVVSDAIEKQEWLLPLAEGVAGAVGAAVEAAGPAGKQIENALNGVWLGHALHPAVVPVPLGAWTAAAVLDTMEASGDSSMAPGADVCVAVGLVGAVGAALTGMAQWYPVDDKPVRKVGMAHALINSTATLCYLGSFAARKSGNRATGRALGWLGFGISMAGAYLGGNLSMGKHLGSDNAPRRDLPTEFTPVMDAVDLPENTPTKATAGKLDLLIVKQGPKIYCLANECSHLKGPLSDGKLEDGCIQCPWHGSRFRLEDGGVVDGPATFGQPAFDVRVRNGRIEVRADPTLPQNHE